MNRASLVLFVGTPSEPEKRAEMWPKLLFLGNQSASNLARTDDRRAVNVLFTRARSRCEVFVSINSGDIDLARTTKQGARVLKRYLRFAETGTLDLPLPIGAGADSPFEEAVAKAIAELGFTTDAQVGSAGFKIDLAVRHPDQPGRYVLAVECDGATYHSARWARERDRLRQEILENLGWSFHRVWSTDWFYSPARERQKLAEAISLAKGRC